MIIPTSLPARRAGFALLMVLILAAASILILGGVMYRGHTITLLNQRNNDYNVCSTAAEAAVEKVFARMAYDFQGNGVAGVSNNMLSGIYKNSVPNATENAFWSNFIFSDPSTGNAGNTYCGWSSSYTGPLPSAYTGLYTAGAPVYRIVSNAKYANAQYNVVGTAQEDVLLALVPLTTWAIFYNGLLEFSTCATMTVNGRVQANGPIYVGSGSALTFNSGVSTTSTLSSPANNGNGPWTPSNWGVVFNGVPNYTTNVASVTVSLNMTNSHFLIDVPPTGESPASATGMQRLYNEAQMVLLVTNAPTGSGNPTVQLTLQNTVNGQVPGNDPAPTILYYTNASPGLLNSNLPFLSLTNSFYDQRETKTNIVTQVDVGRLATWAATNTYVQAKLPASSGIYPTILYVADRRVNSTTQPGQLPVVRLSNAAQLPANNNMGFTVATQNPLYTWGNYNTTTSAGSATGTNAYEVPAALMSDSLTILSSNWKDGNSTLNYASYRDAASTTINAAIVTGTIPSTTTDYYGNSGGVHNLPRLLEDWSSQTLYLNTSILRLFSSNMATNQFRDPGGFSLANNPYYDPPTRKFSFDLNFLNPAKVPPGIPVALVPIRFGWGSPPPNTINYTPTHN